MAQQNSNQVVEVEFPNGNKTYSYIGGGNLRVGQKINNAPVNHYRSGKPYTAPVTVIATHNIVGAEIGDKKAVTNGKVHTIHTGLKYLPGTRELRQDGNINVKGKNIAISNYMSEFLNPAKQRLLSRNSNVDTTYAEQRILGG